jgi:hypothetical protein
MIKNYFLFFSKNNQIRNIEVAIKAIIKAPTVEYRLKTCDAAAIHIPPGVEPGSVQ